MLVIAEEKTVMTRAQYVANRNAYTYPAVGLVGCLPNFHHCTFPSIRSMEDHHESLLRSQDDETAMLGYLSVIYWGHYSGKDGIHRSSRALERVRWAKDGKDRNKHGRMRGVVDVGVAAVAALPH